VGRAAWTLICLALAVGLFPTFRAMVRGPQAPTVETPPTTPSRVAAAAVYAAAAAANRAPVGTTRLMLVGNSVADLLKAGFDAVRPNAVFNAAIPACNFPPLVAATYGNPRTNQSFTLAPCHPSYETLEVNVFHPDVVFWIASDAPRPWSYRGRSLKPCAEPYESLYRRSLRDEIARLGAHGATVVVTTEPYLRYPLGSGVSSLPDDVIDCNNRLRREVADAAGARLVDLAKYVCPGRKCRVRESGVVLRPDGLHYTGPGGVIVARWLIDHVAP
jgi:hypothetical protein